ncbi:hypothetical protein A2V54_01985 [candidate division WWE3 bacterium RBG_19FT_COMBO_53_11]|uniref:Response regulatory domain-containing protein n=1 Tax=candidate division WWE3 bacterium RBG_19FT_COMBO_53_11 TaxID=1802613 RepID=A0A1F4UHY1_UNCKA|nr:MAG: hypothetical protein A2155_01165 [candidate division WWE3 bacterium RBG_16_52_45]OGC44536.1 MAG: hypothetical protein A2V54_01985 [candidate division WWE3 bacterium RBG_19FT_COMBO_53_11]
MARALALKFGALGCETKLASDGEEALQLLGSKRFDLIILDLVMPKLDGFDFLKKMGPKTKKIPVIVLSNLSQEEDAKKARELGAKEFFVKSEMRIVDIASIVKKELGL